MHIMGDVWDIDVREYDLWFCNMCHRCGKIGPVRFINYRLYFETIDRVPSWEFCEGCGGELTGHSGKVPKGDIKCFNEEEI